MREDEPVELEVEEVVSETGGALLVKLLDGPEEWFPKSQIHEDSDIQAKGDEGILLVTRWIAMKKDLL